MHHMFSPLSCSSHLLAAFLSITHFSSPCLSSHSLSCLSLLNDIFSYLLFLSCPLSPTLLSALTSFNSFSPSLYSLSDHYHPCLKMHDFHGSARVCVWAVCVFPIPHPFPLPYLSSSSIRPSSCLCLYPLWVDTSPSYLPVLPSSLFLSHPLSNSHSSTSSLSLHHFCSPLSLNFYSNTQSTSHTSILLYPGMEYIQIYNNFS